MDTLFNEPVRREPLSVFEQAVLDRQSFEFYRQIPHPEQRVEQETVSYELLDLLIHGNYDPDNADSFKGISPKTYGWVYTDNEEDRTDLALAVLEIKQYQVAAYIEKGVFPSGPEVYRALLRNYQDKGYTGTAVYLAEAIMGGDIKEGKIPNLSTPIPPSSVSADTYSAEYIL